MGHYTSSTDQLNHRVKIILIRLSPQVTGTNNIDLIALGGSNIDTPDGIPVGSKCIERGRSLHRDS